jgi:hypothetical protein
VMDTAPAEQQECAQKYVRRLATQAAVVHGFVVGVGGFRMSTSLKARKACSR